MSRRRAEYRVAVAAAAAIAASAVFTFGLAMAVAKPRDPDPAAVLRAAATWVYQLQNVDAAALDLTHSDLIVVDAGPGDGKWGLTSREITQLKSKPDGSRRLVVAYLNIGEAEDYRYYWRKAWEKAPPPWMDSENCRWRGDHRVKHWSPEWQRLIFGSPKSYLGRLIAAGYDGVYLDRVDIFYHWRQTRWQAAQDMIEFVTALSTWAKATRPGFLVLPQNGEELVADARYRQAIDGIGKEDMFFGDAGNEVLNAPERIARAERNFAPATAAGLPVFTVEYARSAANAAQARARHRRAGFRLYLGPRSLAYIGQEGPHHKEDGDTETTMLDDAGGACE